MPMVHHHESAELSVGSSIRCPRIFDQIAGVIEGSRWRGSYFVRPQTISGLTVPVEIELRRNDESDKVSFRRKLVFGSGGVDQIISDGRLFYRTAI